MSNFGMHSLKLILAVWIFAACSGELPVSDFVGGTATLAAEEYQREMEIDRLVFSAEKIAEGGRTALASKLESLSSRARHESGWMIYELKGDELRLAFFDGLRERPEGFEPESQNREPELVVVALKRA